MRELMLLTTKNRPNWGIRASTQRCHSPNAASRKRWVEASTPDLTSSPERREKERERRESCLVSFGEQLDYRCWRTVLILGGTHWFYSETDDDEK